MMDGISDASYRQMYSIVVIRYTKHYQIEEYLLSLEELLSKVGEDIRTYVCY